jgi:hypothetical protein
MRPLVSWWIVLCASCAPTASELSLTPVETPAGAGSSSPNLSLGADGVARLSWLEPLGGGEHALRFCEWDEGGWSAPREVARGAGWFVNWADVPALAALADGTLAAAWLDGLGQGTYAYGIRVALSDDGGASWSPSRWLHADESAVEHGFVSLEPFGQDSFGAVWLDGRATASDGGGHGGAMQLRGRTLRRDGSRGTEFVLDERVCDCCPTALVRVEGRTLVAYRDRGEDEVRDIRLASPGPAGPATRPLHADGWRIEGCPVNGPALAAHGSRVGAVWYSEGSGEPRVCAALSGDGGERFSAPAVLSSSVAFGSVDAAFGPDGRLWASWLEAYPDLSGAWKLARVEGDGRRVTTQRVVAVLPGRAAGVARLAWHDGTLLFAWTEVSDDGATRVRSARLDPAR